MTERKTLSLGAGETSNTDKTAGWNISEARKDKLYDRARFNRRHPSEAHKRLWNLLDKKGVGNFAFNREVVMGSSVVDFACKTRWLVIEIAGETEAERTIEELSDRKLKDVGVRIMRFTPEQIMGDLDPVREAILTELDKPFDKPGRAPKRRDDGLHHRSRY